jgi:hypothetical protein
MEKTTRVPVIGTTCPALKDEYYDYKLVVMQLNTVSVL